MRLAVYTCLAWAVLLFWATVAFMVFYFVHLPSPAYGIATLVCFAGCLGFIAATAGISRYEDAR